MLVIDPDECIDCGLCVPECAPKAIIEEDDDVDAKWFDINSEYAAQWPVITAKWEVPVGADEYEGVTDKFDKFFDPQPPLKMRKSA